ncbi:MAG: hypothetical protein ETSY2_40870 [Candidatus Entotheonella gemina]|uniref:Uncharacterized protein n=1 Tax=Candidatus Entotheonella gemina TaxID=1429439 RepID=W4LPU8_9BACT|nr:MAG: hypothetical protein ETSY2_40870 [Candidatus Entotheonella gemina]
MLREIVVDVRLFHTFSFLQRIQGFKQDCFCEWGHIFKLQSSGAIGTPRLKIEDVTPKAPGHLFGIPGPSNVSDWHAFLIHRGIIAN